MNTANSGVAFLGCRGQIGFSYGLGLCYNGSHYLYISAFLMLRRYGLLARHFVHLDNRYGADAEVVALVRSRTRRIARAPEPVLVAAWLTYIPAEPGKTKKATQAGGLFNT